MDYKEKYEMALEGIQEILGSGEDSIKMSRLQLRLQGIFPELAESEDERIRKVLVELVKCNERSGYFIINNITTSAMLAWLEKQGEQKPYGLREECKDCQCNYAGECKGSCAMKRNEQKPWSKEDEKMFNEIAVHLNATCCGFPEDEKWANKFLDWLKSLKNKIQPQQQWSEENECCRNQLITFCENCMQPDSGAIRCAKWLKSLRPQDWTKEDKERYISCLQRLGTGNPEQPETINSKWFKEHVYPQNRWKPSATDIIVLEGVIDEGINPINYHATLHGILEQLKKLMED